MKNTEQRKAAKDFSERWKNRGYEKGEAQKYWMELLQKVFGVEDPFNFVEFEDQVKNENNITDFIDVVIPSTKILIEQKSIEVDLDKPIRQSNGQLLKPYDQARKYYNNLPKSKLPDYIITCNFKQFNIYDMEKPNGEPERIYLDELESDYYRLNFIVNSKSELLQKELEISKTAGELIGEIYDAFSNELDMSNEENQKIVNVLCVRLVFCLYAEDSGLFNKNLFFNYLKNSDVNHIQNDLLDLFKILNTKEEERNEFTRRDLIEFPYVNGGLFNEEVKIPYFTENIYDILVNKTCNFNWSNISPTIFGSIFESTLNQETRRNNGMHYTSVENIHKVIDPLFLNDLIEEFNNIKADRVRKDRKRKLLDFQNKISNLTFLDPACGSGNFLTESYRSLRELENEIIKELIKIEGNNEGQITFGTNDDFQPIKVHIQQFYGIEINDFAVAVARTALWIQEAQMFYETQNIVYNNSSLDNFLPLDSYDNIHECNALRVDWNDIITKEKCNYIMGNPPFVGGKLMNNDQRADMKFIWGNIKLLNSLDYVSAWYKKASEYIQNTKIKVALVSTNSITQGEQVDAIWKRLFSEGIIINFAYRTFRWDSEANLKAHVHCVIIGFSYISNGNKYLYENDLYKLVKNINGYLMDGLNITVEKQGNPICNVKKIYYGNMPNDDGNLILSEEEKEYLDKKYPNKLFFIKKFVDARDYINNSYRYCLWLKDVDPVYYKDIPEIIERLNKVKEFREKSTALATKEKANVPMEFFFTSHKDDAYILIPRHSSERRKYIPIGFMNKDIISSDANLIIPDATIYDFGILTSNVHMAWMKTVAGRIKSDFRYSNGMVYNTFPWPNPSSEQKKKVEITAQEILNAREKYSNCSLADLYGESMYLYPELLKAHQENDKAVMEAYGFDWRKMSESECVAELMKMYENIIKGSR